MARSKAYLFGGVEIRWCCEPELIKDDTPAEAVFHFPGGLKDYLRASIDGRALVTKDCSPAASRRKAGTARSSGRSAWIGDEDGFLHSYCNTIPTAEGGTHEAASAPRCTKGLRAYGELTGNKKAAQITAEDVIGTAAGDAVGVHPRAGVPGPDQGQARDAGGAPASSRPRSATPSTTGSPTARSRRRGCSSGRSSRPRTA